MTSARDRRRLSWYPTGEPPVGVPHGVSGPIAYPTGHAVLLQGGAADCGRHLRRPAWCRVNRAVGPVRPHPCP